MALPRLDLGNSPTGLRSISDAAADSFKENWQPTAYALSSQIGEVGFLLNLKANTVAKCRLQPQRRIAGTDEWEDTDDPRAIRVMRAFYGPSGGTPEILRRATLHYEIAGEGYLIGTPVKDDRGRAAGLLWEMLSPVEVKVEKGKAKRTPGGMGGGGQVDVPIDGYYARMIHQDAAFSGRSDCVIRRMLPIMEEILLLTQVVDAVAKSRLIAGLLFMPNDISFGNDDESDEDWDDSESGDPFEEELEAYIKRAIEDRSSPNSLVPGLLRAPGITDGHPTKDLIGIIDLAKGLDTLYQELRSESLTRLSAGLDAPPEMITGKGGLNHWTGYNIDAEFVSKHVVPPGEFITEFFTGSYFRPMLKVFESMDREEAEEFRLRFDTSPITARVDAGTTTKEAHDRGIASDLAYARSIGLDVGDMPDPVERKRRTLEGIMLAQPVALGGIVLPMLYPDDPQIAAAASEWPTSAPVQSNDPLPGGQKDPNEVTVPTPRGPNLSERELVQRLAVAADAELEAALKVAGNRVITKIGLVDSKEAAVLRAQRRQEVLSMVGHEKIEALGVEVADLFAGCFDGLVERGTDWIRDYLMAAGLDSYLAEEQAQVAMRELKNLLTLHAESATRRRIRRDSNGLRVPLELVEMALDATRLVRL